MGIRERIARYLVKNVAGYWDLAYNWNCAANMAKDESGKPDEMAKTFEMLYSEAAKRNDWQRKLAVKIHKDGAVDEMVNASWWG